MGREHGLNLQRVQASQHPSPRYTGVPQFMKKAGQRLARQGIGFQLADPGALLAQVHQLKEEAEGVGQMPGIVHA